VGSDSSAVPTVKIAHYYEITNFSKNYHQKIGESLVPI